MTSSHRRPDTLHSGRELKSADFGVSFGGSPPEQPQIPGLGLPPPTQLITVPTEVRSADAVVKSSTSLRPASVGIRVERIARGSVHRARVWAATLLDYSADAGRFCVRALDRAGKAIAAQELGAQTKEVTLTAVRTTAKYSVLGSRASLKAARQAYADVRRALDEGYVEAAPVTKAPAIVGVATPLRSRAAVDGPAVTELPAGAEVSIYPGHDAPPGWALAQTATGEIGFVSTRDLQR